MAAIKEAAKNNPSKALPVKTKKLKTAAVTSKKPAFKKVNLKKYEEEEIPKPKKHTIPKEKAKTDFCGVCYQV